MVFVLVVTEAGAVCVLTPMSATVMLLVVKIMLVMVTFPSVHDDGYGDGEDDSGDACDGNAGTGLEQKTKLSGLWGLSRSWKIPDLIALHLLRAKDAK